MPVSCLFGRLPFRCHSSLSASSLLRLYSNAPSLSGWDPQPSLSLEMKLQYERIWKQYVDNFSFKENDVRPNMYVLSMFPYPSGKLHMGHVRVYTISDTLARFYRMQGYNVLHPMGWDAFGLPAENAAIQSGEDPAVWTEKNISIMRSQLQQLGCSFDWDREFATCHPDYYKWTQYIFLQMYKAGLIYRKPSIVNWDPVDKTVLADEQIDENGNSWRSGAKAEKVLLTQWFVRSTIFSVDLLKELKNFHKEDWADIINLQKSWIGEVDGTVFDWKIEGVGSVLSVPIWTAQPEHVDKVDFIAVKPGTLLDVLQSTKSFDVYQYKTSDGNIETFKAALLDFVACNPFSEEKVPIYVVDGILPFHTGSDTYMGVSSKLEIDSTFANSIGLPFRMQTRTGVKNVTAESVRAKAQKKGFGGYLASSNLKDWLISRQRYWGTPIPIVHCASCGAVPVPEDQLPVTLPAYTSKKVINDKIASPLAQAEEWISTTCPKCGGSATRETDTMDTFVDSSWYYLRYLDPSNHNELVRYEKAKQFMPVNVYIGGKEHATLHLYYARIVCHFLHKIGIASSAEPFQRLLVQGMVMGQTFIEEDSGRYLKRDEVEFDGKTAVSRATGKSVAVKWDKMSKSKHNGVDPADALKSFGVDSTRLFMLADAAPFSQRNWDPEGSKGVANWQNNLYMLVSHFISMRENGKMGKLQSDQSSASYIDGEKQSFELRNKSLSTITHHYKNTHQFMVAIKSMQTLTKKLKLLPAEVVAFGSKFEEALATLIITTAPMAPHFASELWRGFVSAPGRLNDHSTAISWEKPVLEQSWPALDPEFELPLTINVNRSDVCTTMVTYGKLKTANEDDILHLSFKQAKIKDLISDKTYKVLKIGKVEERGARIFLHVPELKVSEDDTTGSFTKEGRQALAKQKKKKEQNVAK